jgi:hypothetical protein
MRRRRRVVVTLLLLLIAAIAVPPFVRMNRYQKELESNLGNALGRKVYFLGDINLRLLPQPAIVAENFVMEDDPAFGVEPMLRSEVVTARLRLSSLWRGRLEIARLSFDYPSWNLVRNTQGRWNVESLLQRTSQVQTAPTSLTRVQAAPRFPYIETDNGRINFKTGDEKIAHALLDSDLALWQESDNQWNLRFEGRLTRTDSNLSDTGTLRAQGSFTRSHGEPLEQVPFKLHLEMERGQLGQLTALFTGIDRGWRGNIDATADLSGSLQDLDAKTRMELRDFRRFDIMASDFMKAEVRCTAKLSKSSGFGIRANGIDCKLPIEPGQAQLTGEFAFNGGRQYHFRVVATGLPMGPLGAIFRRSKFAVPEDFTASGLLSGTFDFARAENEPGVHTAFAGQITGFAVSSKSLNTDFDIGRVGIASIAATPQKGRRLADATENWMVFDPIGLDLGGKQPVVVAARLSGSQFIAQIEGNAAVPRMLAAAKTFGFAQRDYNANGMAELQLTIVGPLHGFDPPTSTGSIQLQQLSLISSGMALPFRVASAKVQFTPTGIVIDRILGTWEGTHTTFDGNVRIARTCDPTPCPVQFDLRANELDIDDLNRQFNPRFRATDWLALPKRLIGGEQSHESILTALNATGKIAIGKVVLKSLVAQRASANLVLQNGMVRATDLRADLLGGRHLGTWTADFTHATAAYDGSGAVDNISVPQLALLADHALGTGTLSGDYRLAFTGDTPSAFQDSASGNLRFDWRNGLLRQVTVDGDPLAFSHWSGAAEIADSKITLRNGQIQTRKGALLTSGSVTFDRALAITFAGETQTMVLTGTVEKPLVEVQTATANAAGPVSASKQKNGSQKPVR